MLEKSIAEKKKKEEYEAEIIAEQKRIEEEKNKELKEKLKILEDRCKKSLAPEDHLQVYTHLTKKIEELATENDGLKKYKQMDNKRYQVYKPNNCLMM